MADKLITIKERMAEMNDAVQILKRKIALLKQALGMIIQEPGYNFQDFEDCRRRVIGQQHILNYYREREEQ